MSDVSVSQEAVVHALVGAQFGDLEFDLGKSVRWTQWFVDDVFVTDINLGTQRYWVINWAQSFPEVNYAVTGINYFVDPIGFRKQQWADAQRFANVNPDLLVFDDSDWVLFVDGHEGLSADNTSLPDDYQIEQFRSYIYREIARAEDNSEDRVVLPFFVYLRHDHIQTASYHIPPMDTSLAALDEVVEQSVGVPYYLPYQGLTRLVKVSALRESDFDWATLDAPTAVVDPTVKMQVISYGYAHWNLQDIEPPATTVPPLSAENDDGWQQRCLLSRVRPITGLPFGSSSDPVGTWVSPSIDPSGVRGPWAFDTYGDIPKDVVIPSPPPPVDPVAAGVLVPLYDLVFRFNMRDGVWYEADGLGNIPLVWDNQSAAWIPAIPVKDWQNA